MQPANLRIDSDAQQQASSAHWPPVLRAAILPMSFTAARVWKYCFKH
jgi:hypothetical protein